MLGARVKTSAMTEQSGSEDTKTLLEVVPE